MLAALRSYRPPAKDTLLAIVRDLYDDIVAAKEEQGLTYAQIIEAMGLSCSPETLANAKLRVKRDRELKELRAERRGGQAAQTVRQPPTPAPAQDRALRAQAPVPPPSIRAVSRAAAPELRAPVRRPASPAEFEHTDDRPDDEI